MVRECHPPHPGQPAHFDHITGGTVPPPFSGFVFFIRELGIVNHQVSPRKELTVAPVSIMDAVLGSGIPFKRLMIAGIDDHHAVHFQPIPQRQHGVIQIPGGHCHAANFKLALPQVMKMDFCTQLIEGHWEIAVLHLTRERVPKRFTKPGRAVNVPTPMFVKQRGEEWEPLNVIPMRVTDEQTSVQRGIGTGLQRLAQIEGTASAVDHHQSGIGSRYLNAGSVAPISHHSGPGPGKGTSGSPKLNLSGGRHEPVNGRLGQAKSACAKQAN